MARTRPLSETYRTMANLRRFFESVRRTITTEPTDGGLTSAQQFALLTVAGHAGKEPLSVGDLARLTFATMNTTSALVRRMERADLVRTARSARDRRVVYVTLTPFGEHRLRPSTVVVAKALRAAADEQGRAQLRAAFDTWFDDWGAVIRALSSPPRQSPRRRVSGRRQEPATSACR